MSYLPDVVRTVWSGFAELKDPSVPNGDFLTWMIASLIGHTILYWIVPVSPWLPKKGETPPDHKGPKPYDRFGEEMKIRNGLVSTFHAIVACLMCITWYINYYPTFELWNWQRWMQGGIATPGNINGDAWFGFGTSFTLGYFLYDLIIMIYYHRYLGNFGAYLHHIAIGLAFGVGLAFGCGRAYHFLMLFEELSTPALNFKNLYRHSPRAYKFWGIAFVLAFYGSRGLFGLTFSATVYYSIWNYWSAHTATSTGYFDFLVFLQFFMFTSSRLLNIYWMSLIAKYIRNPEAKSSKKSLEKVQKAE